MECGALASCWSGAGPSLLGISPEASAEKVCAGPRVALEESGLTGRVLVLPADRRGLVYGEGAKFLSSGVPEPRSYLKRVCACGLPRDLRSAARHTGSAKMSPVKRSERWARDSDGATSNRKSSAGPLRRRRASVIWTAWRNTRARELSPTAAVTRCAGARRTRGRGSKRVRKRVAGRCFPHDH